MTDYINAALIVGGAIFAWLSVRELYKDKKVLGVYWQAWFFYSICSIWDLYYYPSVGHSWSFWAVTLLVIANVLWVVLAIHYRKKPEVIIMCKTCNANYYRSEGQCPLCKFSGWAE